MMDIDHDEAFLNEEDADNHISDLDHNAHTMLDGNNGGFDTSIDQALFVVDSKDGNATLIENKATSDHSNGKR